MGDASNGPSPAERGLTQKDLGINKKSPLSPQESKTPFRQFLESEAKRDKTPIFGGEIIRPGAVRVDDPRNPDGSINITASKNRGWLSAINSANGRQDIPDSEKQKNVQEIVNGALAAGVSRDQLGNHLQALGIRTVLRENVVQPQAGGSPQKGAENQVQVDEASITRSMDYINKLADSVLGGRSEPGALQNYVDYAMRNGVPKDRVQALLRAKGIPVSERQDQGPEAKPAFDPQKPIDGKTYNDLTRRFNELRSRLLQQGDRATLGRLNGLPMGRILNGPFPEGDTQEARVAYNQISNILDDIEGGGQPPSTEQSSPLQEPKLEPAEPGERKYTPEQIRELERFGKLYGDLLTTFSETPGITREELMRQLGDYVKENRLAGPNVGRAVGMINRFCQLRDRVRTVREQFSDDRALFEHTFGFTPQGEVKVVMGSVDIAFHTPNPSDRERVFGVGQRGAKSAAGFVVRRTQDTSLAGAAIILEYNNTPDILDHERQHVVNNRLLNIRELGTAQSFNTISEKINAGVNPEMAISDYLDTLRNTRLAGSVDEIIAYARCWAKPDEVKQDLTQHNTSYGERYRGLNSNFEDSLVKSVGEQYRDFIRQKGNEDLGEGYDQIVRDCVDAFQELRSRGYTQEQTVGRLAVIPPQDWKSFVAETKGTST